MSKVGAVTVVLLSLLDDPESLAGSHASVLMRAAYAAEDAGEIERALALMNAALDELDPQKDARERIEALLVKARTAANLVTGGGLEPLQEAHAEQRDREG